MYVDDDVYAHHNHNVQGSSSNKIVSGSCIKMKCSWQLSMNSITTILILLLLTSANVNAARDNCSPNDESPISIPIPSVLKLPDMAPILKRGHDVSGDYVHSTAMKMHSEGRISTAVQLFAISTKLLPFGSRVWTNFGYSLIDLAGSSLTLKDDKVGLICEAVASLDLALALGGEKEGIVNAREDAIGILTRSVDACGNASTCLENKCIQPRGERYGNARYVVMEASHLSSLSITEMLCSDEMGVTIHIEPYERMRDVLSAQTVFELFVVFRFCGVVALHHLMDERNVETVRVNVEQAFEDSVADREHFLEYRRDHNMHRVEGERLALRDKSGADARWELKLPVTDPAFQNTDVVDNSLLHGLSKLLMAGPNVVIDTLSTVISLPGCPLGHWHGDVEDPFFYYTGLMQNNHPTTPSRHLPPPGVIAVVPLVQVGDNVRNGPTEFLMGSHIPPLHGENQWWNQQQDTRTKLAQSLEIAIPATPGTVLLFDIRLRHRGGANHSNKPRPVLYLGYTMRWFKDAANFVDPHTLEWEALDGLSKRSLFARLDTREYTTMLERELVEVYGADLNAIKARAVGVEQGGVGR